MKRLAILVTAFTLLLTTASPAFVNTFNGSAGGTGTVSFQANIVIKKGKCIRRNRFGRCIRRKKRRVATQVLGGLRFDNLPITCDDGNHTLDLTKSTSTPVSAGHFSSTGSGGGSTISLSGQFARGARSATGTIRDSGTIGTHTGCDTGVLSWSAHI